jgi:hypothetical protein
VIDSPTSLNVSRRCRWSSRSPRTSQRRWLTGWRDI